MNTPDYTEDELLVQRKDKETFRNARTAAQRRIERKTAEATRILTMLLDGVSGDDKTLLLEGLTLPATQAREEACRTLYAGIAFAADIQRLAAAEEAYRMASAVCGLLDDFLWDAEKEPKKKVELAPVERELFGITKKK